MRILVYIFALLAVLSLNAQDFYDINTIQTIEITFAESNWDQLLDAEKSGDENYILAQSISINGTVFDSIGVKYKGNSTYRANQIKNPFHIELDTYKDHEYDGYTDIKLSNVAKDPSFLREVLSYQILRQYMDAPLSNYANVYVNGTLIGLYSNSEAVSKKFVNNRFGSKNNTFVKCNPPEGAGPQSKDFPNLVYLGQDSTDYYDAYELKSDEGWIELIDLCATLGNTVDHVENVLDVDRALWMLAFDNVLVNLDSYIGAFAQNYYLYKDDYGRFLPVVWDLNESFGRFSMTGSGNLNSTTQKQQMSHLLNENNPDFPLVQSLLSVPLYKRMYLAHYKTMLLENFDNGAYFAVGQELQTIINAAVQADVNKFFTYDNFLTNLTTDVGGGGGPGPPGGNNIIGITTLMDGRTDYLLGLTDFTNTEPTISEVTLSNPNPVLKENIFISVATTDANTVYLGYRSEDSAPFTRVPMYDDGLNGDGAANDGVFTYDLFLENSFYQYYIYAENENIGLFSPRRAEYEYHTLTPVLPEPEVGDLVINEFLASNDSVQMDQDGEYDDWIELYNNGNERIELGGYYLSDDPDDLMQWTFPEDAFIDADGYLIVWADNDDLQEGYHANFKLAAASENVILSDSDGNIVDLISYMDQITDVSFGRFPNGTGNFESMEPTFNGENNPAMIVDADNDGYTSDVDCDDTNAMVNPDAEEVPYNGLDDDCNAATLDDDLDEDGFARENDCDDTNAMINPDAEEILDNDIDEDCDGMDLSTAIHDFSVANIRTFPNPANNYIIVEMKTINNNDVEIEMYDILGRIVEVENVHSGNGVYKIDVRSLNTGKYFIKINDGLDVYSRSVIVTK